MTIERVPEQIPQLLICVAFRIFRALVALAQRRKTFFIRKL